MTYVKAHCEVVNEDDGACAAAIEVDVTGVSVERRAGRQTGERVVVLQVWNRSTDWCLWQGKHSLF